MNQQTIKTGTYVEAQLAGIWIPAYYIGPASNGHIVSFDADSPNRIVKEVKELNRYTNSDESYEEYENIYNELGVSG